MTKRLVKLGMLVALLASLAGCGGRTPQLPPLTPDSTIVAFGASLTHGTGVPRDKSYPAVLAKQLGLTVINAGVPGEVTAVGLKRLPALLEEHAPDLVLISHGGNDILRKLDLASTKANLRQMIELTRAYGAEAVLIAIPEPALFLSAAPFYQELSEEMNVAVELDVVARLQTSAKYKSDAIHFNAQGYTLLAKAVEELLRAGEAVR